MKIAFVCNEYWPTPSGGIGTWTYAIVHALKSAGDEVWVVSMRRDTPHTVREDDQGVHVIRMPASRAPKWQVRALLDRLKMRRVLAQLQKTQGIEIVEIPDYQGFGAFYKHGCPLVVRLHHSGGWSKTTPHADHPMRRLDPMWCARQSLYRADQIIAVSDWGRTTFKENFPNLSHVSTIYYNIADVFLEESVEPVERQKNLVVFAGTLVERKGIWELAAAWPTVKQRFPQAQLVMIGKDQRLTGSALSNREILKQKLADHEVTFIDHVSQPELSQWYRRATVACFPSKSETFGLVAAEAMACETPVIYTKAHPGPEVSGNGERALMIDPNNPVEIADSICEVLADPARQQARITAAAEWVRANLSRAAVIPRNRAMYQSLIRKGS